MGRIFHGTTWDNYQNILANGFGGKRVWVCSDTSVTYGYDAAKNDETGNDDYLISQAFESAKLAAAAQNYLGEKLVVLELVADDELIHDDDSCPNMDDIASYIENDKLSKANIAKVWIADNGYNPAFKLFYIMGVVVANDMFNTDCIPYAEQEACKQLRISGVEIYDIYETDWRLYECSA
jgi:hypothetical protein